jgi:hypothetical protein
LAPICNLASWRASLYRPRLPRSRGGCDRKHGLAGESAVELFILGRRRIPAEAARHRGLPHLREPRLVTEDHECASAGRKQRLGGELRKQESSDTVLYRIGEPASGVRDRQRTVCGCNALS